MTTITPFQFDRAVEAEAAGWATPDQLAILEADPGPWKDALLNRLADVEEGLVAVRSLTGPEREQVVADFESEQTELVAALQRVAGDEAVVKWIGRPAELDEELDAEDDDDEADDLLAELEPAELSLQVSWLPGRVVAWAAGPRVPAADEEHLRELLAEAGGPSAGWIGHTAVPLPNGGHADALSIAVADILGWLHAIGAGKGGEDIGPSLRWLGQISVWAVSLTAQGSMVPLLRQRRRRGRPSDTAGSFSIRWTPALLDPDQLRIMSEAMPGAVGALDTSLDARAIVRSALTGMVDAICRRAASQINAPAAPPRPRTATDVAEAVLALLDGTHFDAPVSVAGKLIGDMDQWARPITSGNTKRLVVQLDPPDSGNAWHLQVLAPQKNRRLLAVEVAMVNAGSQGREIDDQLTRLERLFPALRRPGSHRRGEVVLSQDEAWDLMTEKGAVLRDAGFDVRVPELSLRKPSPSLRLVADTSTPSAVGARQLANVSWSVLFDDVELTAADVARLAKEARPLVRSGGKWIELDKADLEAAAASLAERADKTQLSGAEMLRHALGLEGSPLSGGVSVEGNGWAAEVLARASSVSGPAPEPEGFRGELRSYQGEALAWLSFLDSAGLGGCLALDMGLGKTPTMLAHLLATAGNGPALVIAPPAVVGNWAAEAAKFTPRLRVVVHHGASRASARAIAGEAAHADVIITTYGTAVRDIEALESVEWERIVLDEAQAIKNVANETAQQLRRLNARVRVALTGTPIENGLGDLWAILDFTNPGLVGPRPAFITSLSNTSETTKRQGEDALTALNGLLVFRRTKAEPSIAAELPDRIDELDHCSMTAEQIGLYQAVLDKLVTGTGAGGADEPGEEPRKGQILAAITALKQICNHPSAYQHDDQPLAGRSGKLSRLEEIVDNVFAAGERVLVFTHFASWGERLADHLTERTGTKVHCYHGGLSRGARDRMIADFQAETGPGALVLSLKAGGTGLNLTNANHVVLYDRWWNPAVEDQARDRAWRIGQQNTVIAHRLVCPGTVDERVEEVVAGKRHIADMVLPKSSSLSDLDAPQLRAALGLRADQVLTDDDDDTDTDTSSNKPSEEDAA